MPSRYFSQSATYAAEGHKVALEQLAILRSAIATNLCWTYMTRKMKCGTLMAAASLLVPTPGGLTGSI